jgi:Predicted nucleotide-binding protein containing TIR-like domain
MPSERPIAICYQRRDNLSGRQLRFFDAMTAKLRSSGFSLSPENLGMDRIAERYADLQDCRGVIIPAFSQWEGHRLNRNRTRTWTLPSEFVHIVAAMAVAARRPLLVLLEKGVDERGVLKRGLLHPIIDMPSSLDPDWFETSEFTQVFEKWSVPVRRFKDIFLGYSTQADEIGERIGRYLKGLGLQVYDWHDFPASQTIWDSIQEAVHLTRCGVFLFMADDKLKSPISQYAPRDNVVYEAGYFAGARGRERTLVIREGGAKVPTDLGGVKYIVLDCRDTVVSIETPLRMNIERILNARAFVAAAAANT